MQTPSNLPQAVGNDVPRTPKPAPRPAGRGRIALATGAILTAAACGLSAPVQEPPADPVPYDEVVGLWENGNEGAIEFREDGSYTITGWTFNMNGWYEVPPGGAGGTWKLCESIYEDESEQHFSTECVESDEGEYLILNSYIDGAGGELFFTEDQQLELYHYVLEDHTPSNSYYAKAD